MKLLATSDIHFHPFPAYATVGPDGVNSRLTHTFNRVQELYAAAKTNGCSAILFAGDLFHTKKIDAETLDLAVKAFQNPPVPIIGVPGNHDMATFGADARHSARVVGSVRWLDTHGGREIEIDGLKIYGIPYVRERLELLKEIERAPNCSILLMHAGFAGATMGSDYIADLGDCADPEWVYGKKFKLVVTGHFHQPQVISKAGEAYNIAKPTGHDQRQPYKEGETILVPGSPEQHNWGDTGSVRGYWIIDTTERMLTFQRMKSPEFVEVRIAADAERAKGNYVRVPECCEAEPGLMKRLEQEACGVTVEFTPVVQAKPMRGYEVGAGDRPEDVLQKYVVAADTKLDRKVLMEFGRRFIA